MNKWLYRAVGTVGVASGFLLLGGGAAHAQDANTSMPSDNHQGLRGLLDDLFTPTGGLSNLGLSLDLPGTSLTTVPADAPLALRGNDGRTGDVVLSGMLPDLADALPAVTLTRTGLRGIVPAAPTSATAAVQPEFLPALDGITGGLTGQGGLGGILSGLGNTSGGGLLSGVTSGLTRGGLTDGLLGGSGGGDPLGGLTGGLLDGGGGGLARGLLGGDSEGGPLGGLTGGLLSGGGEGGPLGGLTGGLLSGGGEGGPLGGLTGGLLSGDASGLLGGGSEGGPLGGLTGGLLGGDGGGLASGLTGGLLGGDGAGLLGGLTGDDSNGLLDGVTGALAPSGDGDGLLGGLTGGLAKSADSDGLLGGLTKDDSDGLLGGLTDGLPSQHPEPMEPQAPAPAQQPVSDEPAAPLPQEPSGPLITTTTGLPLDAATAQAAGVDPSMIASKLVPQLIANAIARASVPTPNLAALDPRLSEPVGQAAPPAGQGDLSAYDPSMFDPAAGALSMSMGDPSMSPAGFDQGYGQGLDPNGFDLSGFEPGAAGQDGFAADQGVPPGTFIPDAPLEGLPIVDRLPIVGPIFDSSGPLGQFIVVGDIANQLPFVGGLIKNGEVPDPSKLPIIGKILGQGIVNTNGKSGLPIVGSLPFVGDMINTVAGKTPLGGLTDVSALTGGITGDLNTTLGGGKGGPLGILNNLTNGIASSAGLGDLTSMLDAKAKDTSPLAGLASGLLNAAAKSTPFNAPPPRMLPTVSQAKPKPGKAAPRDSAHVGRHRATERPIAGDDAEYPAASSGEEGLPLTSTLSQIPVVNELPLVSSLPVPMALLRSLPVVGVVASLLPLD